MACVGKAGSIRGNSIVDCSDVEVRVAFPDEKGYFIHRHVNPIFLERCEIGESLSSPVEMLLMVASAFYEGKGSLEDLYYYQEEYRKARCADENCD